MERYRQQNRSVCAVFVNTVLTDFFVFNRFLNLDQTKNNLQPRCRIHLQLLVPRLFAYGLTRPLRSPTTSSIFIAKLIQTALLAGKISQQPFCSFELVE